MTSLDSLLRQAADAPSPPPGFAADVHRAVMARAERRQNLRLLRWGLLLCAAVAAFFYVLSALLLDVLSSPALDVVGLAAEDPSVLRMSEGWLALSQSLPFVSAGLTVAAVAVVAYLARKFLASLSFPGPHAA